MVLSRRDALRLGLIGTGLGLSPFGLNAVGGRPALAEWSGGGARSHGESLLGSMNYGPEYTQFDYANAAAPKGGVAKLYGGGKFDTLNPFNAKGDAPVGATLPIETLMVSPLDEGSTHYGLLAEWMEWPKDYSWAAFKLRPEARFHDGSPVTVADVQASFQILVDKGAPFFRFYYQNVSEVVDEGDGIVRFKLDTTGNRELPHILGQLYIMPAKAWESRPFDETTLEPIPGSGPYRTVEVDVGKRVVFERVEDYWGKDLPPNIGAHNFDRLSFEAFLDRDIAFEAFKKGEIDYWVENSASRWAERYDFPAARQGKVVKREPVLQGPQPIQGFAFNLRLPKFQNRLVREAIAAAFDFERTNRQVYFGQYARPYSYFQGTPALMATDLPAEGELALLEPFRDQLPPKLFTEPFKNVETDGSGRDRAPLRFASQLLDEAGWTIEDKVRKNADGETLTVEFLSAQAQQDKVFAPYAQRLRRLGIDAQYRLIDQAQFINRVRSYDFDMIIDGWSNSESPGNEQREFWGAASADAPGGRNTPGVKNPVVDALIEKIIFAENREALETASRALDRVLLWEHYSVMQLYTPYERIAHWNKFGAPDPLPARRIGFPTVWWWDADKAAEI
ncbi:MAG: extracellular solute-binding protein [Pseudomonadota bacterium]